MLDRIRIALVEPSHPGNIGGTARAMKNMGLRQLVVVKPKRFPDPQADWRAAGALDVLDAAQVVETVDEAVKDSHWVVGTSTRNRRIPWPVAGPGEIASEIAALPDESTVTILFGREDNGLTNEELQRCHYHLQIPAHPDYSSLNLAMAVQVVTYELYQASLDRQPVPGWDRRLATAAELDALMRHMETVLIDSNFLDASNPGQTMTRLRRLYTRIQMDETEVQILRGVLKHLAPARNATPDPPVK